MARYYKYRSPADLVADAESLGVALATRDDMGPLFEPVTIGGRTVKNRLVVQPMEGCDATLEGLPGELTTRRYVRFGDGGAGVVWAEATAIAEDARMNPRQLWLADHSAAAIGQMLEQCRQSHRDANGNDEGLLVGLQLTHSGRYSYQRPQLAVHDPLLDPLTVDKSSGRSVGADWPLLSDDQLQQIEDQYLAAAHLAAGLGADFVDIKQCHRYLLSELLAARHRPGRYGGSLENRTRLVRNVIGRIRDELPDLAVASRFNAYDGIPYCKSENPPDHPPDQEEKDNQVGVPCSHSLPLEAAFGTDPDDHLREQLDEPIALARMLAGLGVVLLNVSGGNPYANPHVVRPAEFPPVDGYDSPEHPLLGVCRLMRLARTIQRAVPEVPVVGSGYSWLQDLSMHVAAAQVADGDVALAGLGRGTLSQPDFARVLEQQGSLNRKQVCRTFSYCTNLMRAKDHPLGQYPTGCPPFDKEAYGPLWAEAKEKLEGPEREGNG